MSHPTSHASSRPSSRPGRRAVRGMSADARRDLPLAAVAAATTWVTMLSWHGFSDLWGQFLGPLVLVAIVVPVTGVLLRAAPLPRRLGALVHLLVIVALVWLILGGSPVHPFASTDDLAGRIGDAWVSAETYQPPIPQSVPGIAPLLIPCGALALYVVDALACWLRRVPLAGLPLLAVYCVPISVIGDGVSGLVFLFAAAGFLLMMFLQESAHIARWGRPLGESDAAADPHGFGVHTGASRGSATTVGSIAVVLAVILPLFIPTLHLDGLGLFGPGGDGGKVKVVNPIADMRRNLHRGADVPLLTVRTDDPDPTYLRIAVLTQFNGIEWSSGNRSIVSDQTASGLLPFSEQGLAGSVPTDPRNYTVTATSDFDSRWLPTTFPATSVKAFGDWHWDASTMDFISANDSTNTAGLTWTMSAQKPRLSSFSMINSLSAPESIQGPFTATPTTLPTYVGDLARRVTQHADSRFERAVTLQNWFRDNFRYRLKSAEGDSNEALLHFLTPGKDHRVGYCEQFAAAFAVMARTLDIPARVAIGFLSPQKTGQDEYVFSAHDMHAWPEVYFRGSGWVRFEPTPSRRAGAVPAYTVGRPVRPGHENKTPNKAGGRNTEDPSSAASPKDLPQATTSSTSSGGSVPWVAGLAVLLVLALLGAVAAVPGALRRRRRARRLDGGAEDAWSELRDSALDLGVGWPAGRSPHETGHLLKAWFGAEPDGPPLIRPPRGRGMAPGAEDALDRIVLTLERVRYAPRADDVPGALAEDVQRCIVSLEQGSTRSALRRARWFPRSLFGRARRAAARADLERSPEVVAGGGVVDHVG
jgi:transglutaminase-like putative cysteine protease